MPPEKPKSAEVKKTKPKVSEERRAQIRAELKERLRYGLSIKEWRERKGEIEKLSEKEKGQLTKYAGIRRRGQKRSSTSQAMAEYGAPAMKAIASHGDRAADVIVKSKDEYAAHAINQYGREAVDIMRKHGSDGLDAIRVLDGSVGKNQTQKALQLTPAQFMRFYGHLPAVGRGEPIPPQIAERRKRVSVSTRNFAYGHFARANAAAMTLQQQENVGVSVLSKRKRLRPAA